MKIDFLQIALKRDIDYLVNKNVGFLLSILSFGIVVFATTILGLFIGGIAQFIGSAIFGSTAGSALAGLATGLGAILIPILTPILIIITLIIFLIIFGIQFIVAKILGGQAGFSAFFNKMLYLLTSLYLLFWLITLPFQFVSQILALGIQDATISGAVSVILLITLLIELIQFAYSIYLETVLTQKLMGISNVKAFISAIFPLVLALLLVLIVFGSRISQIPQVGSTGLFSLFKI